eukprot:CAMPEP_0197240248 /NCGR_PEP_ID=MMETSP1429-20130617/6572_1 /TAXON_ID=49237 /ORGANISM="Chaetoceros  sp., Strain UNC1202" /LENGTH=63 /DNA_ID=CAMNT_0042699847 /DNA_START=75 /DNA_END=263 /DNA_ORIENTATION=-
MTDANLFQLGIGLETGAQEEDISRAVHPAQLNAIAEADREDHFIRRDGKVFAGTHLIIEVMKG